MNFIKYLIHAISKYFMSEIPRRQIIDESKIFDFDISDDEIPEMPTELLNELVESPLVLPNQ